MNPTELQYKEVTDPLEVQYFFGFMYRSEQPAGEKWWMIYNGTDYEFCKYQIEQWKETKSSTEDYKNATYRIFSIMLPY